MRAGTLGAKVEQRLARLRQKIGHFGFVLSKVLRRRGNASQLNQDVLAGELAMRIAAGRDVALGFNGVMKIEDFGGSSQRRVDLLLVPDIERAFGFLSVL